MTWKPSRSSQDWMALQRICGELTGQVNHWSCRRCTAEAQPPSILHECSHSSPIFPTQRMYCGSPRIPRTNVHCTRRCDAEETF